MFGLFLNSDLVLERQVLPLSKRYSVTRTQLFAGARDQQANENFFPSVNKI